MAAGNEKPALTCEQVLDRLAALGSAENRAGMARFGIETARAYGVSVAALRTLARDTGRNHDLAQALWQSGRHEARILAVLIDEPARVGEDQVDRWVADIDSWDLCDQFCNNLVRRLPFARAKAEAWSGAEAAFVKRAGFSLMASLAVHDKAADEKVLRDWLGIIEREADDDRNFVMKAINWALRQIGKRSVELNAAAIDVAGRLKQAPSRAARWVGNDAHRELTGAKVQAKLRP